MKLRMWIFLTILIFVIIWFLPYFLGFYDNEHAFVADIKQREKDCDICLSSFKIPCNATAGLNRECMDKYLEANQACVYNCTIPLQN